MPQSLDVSSASAAIAPLARLSDRTSPTGCGDPALVLNVGPAPGVRTARRAVRELRWLLLGIRFQGFGVVGRSCRLGLVLAAVLWHRISPGMVTLATNAPTSDRRREARAAGTTGG